MTTAARLAEDIAEVGDRGGDFGDPRYGEGTEREPGDSGRRFVASEPVEMGGEAGQRDAERRGVARIVEVADRPQSQFDQGYANNGPVTANKRSDISAQKTRSQIARAKNLNSAIRSSPSPTSCRMTVLSRSRSPAVRDISQGIYCQPCRGVRGMTVDVAGHGDGGYPSRSATWSG